MSQTQSDSFGKTDKARDDRPSSSIDIYDQAVRSAATDDEFLNANNLGLGNYSDAEYWQQVEAFGKGLFADAAFARRLIDRATTRTKRKLADEGWRYVTENGATELSGWQDRTNPSMPKREYLDTRGEEIWDALPEDQQIAAMEQHAGVERYWRPPFWRMLLARHEMSRSRGSRLLDNVFGRVNEQKHEVEGDAADKFSLGRGRSR